MSKNNIALKGTNGNYFVLGQGFTAPLVSAASLLSNEQVASALNVGFTGTVEEVATKSFAVVYIRKGDANGTTLNKQAPNANLGQVDPSKRRFETRDEAIIHGSRFATRRARKSDPVGSGTAGHIGFYVIETNDPVNSAVNPATGLTNSL